MVATIEKQAIFGYDFDSHTTRYQSGIWFYLILSDFICRNWMKKAPVDVWTGWKRHQLQCSCMKKVKKATHQAAFTNKQTWYHWRKYHSYCITFWNLEQVIHRCW